MFAFLTSDINKKHREVILESVLIKMVIKVDEVDKLRLNNIAADGIAKTQSTKQKKLKPRAHSK